MGLVNMLFRKSGKSDDIGGHAAKLVLDFLGTTSQVEATPFTFTEMFAFVCFEIVNVVFNRKTSIGPSVVESLSKAYCETMDKEFRLSQNEMHLAMLNTRIQEYGTMLNSQKEKSDIVEKLDFYLNQAYGIGNYHRDDDSPLVCKDAFARLAGKQALAEFYISSFAPFIKTIIAHFESGHKAGTKC